MIIFYQKGFLQLLSDPFTVLHLQKKQHVTSFSLQIHEDLTHFTQLHGPIKSLGYFSKLLCGTKPRKFLSPQNQIQKCLSEQHVPNKVMLKLCIEV